MTLVTPLALFLSLLALPFASARLTIRKLGLALCILILHVGATALSYDYAQTHIADSAMYYYDLWHFAGRPWWSLSTTFVIHLTQLFRNSLGASYFDCFMMFQTIGFWGIIILMRTFEEIKDRIASPESAMSSVLLFMPTIHYWTSPIGKDAILFFAIALSTWSSLNLQKRYLRFAFGVLVMTMARAHIAAVVMASLVIAAAMYRGLSFGRRLVLLVPAFSALLILGVVVQSSIGLNLSDAGSVAKFLEEKSVVIVAAAGNTSLNTASFPMRLLSLLFRPFFVDARNMLGIVASVENLFILLMFFYFLFRWREVIDLYRKVFFIRFSAVLTLSLILLLAIVNYNVGLGLRERTMFLPPLLSIFVALWAFRQRMKLGQQPGRVAPPPGAQMPVPAVAAARNLGPRT